MEKVFLDMQRYRGERDRNVKIISKAKNFLSLSIKF